ncbi:MAG: RDD family protein [Chloroflexi bacterium]|nr:RDD family protein [Chloroflexota bacterium]MYD39944.1 RDD family protein [Chloroflexota bacterium]MYH66844.1 RDD family protein [Chloroflexota bacterium]
MYTRQRAQQMQGGQAMGKKSKQGAAAAAAETVHELAGIVPRFLAGIIDGFLLLLLLLLLMVALSSSGHLFPPALANFFGLAVPVFYFWYFWTRRDGQTPGKFALSIRVVKADGTAISDVDAVIRAIGYQVSGALFGLGYLWALIDRKNQAWHDKLARTYVVRSQSQRRTVEIG